MTAVFIITTVISLLAGVDAAIASGIAKDRNNKVTKIATKITNEIAKDNALMQQLQSAYTSRDYSLAQNLIGTNPTGTASRLIKQAIKENKKLLSDVNSKMSTQAERQSQAQTKVNELTTKHQSSGSAVVDLISGGMREPQSVEYKSSGITPEQVKGVKF